MKAIRAGLERRLLPGRCRVCTKRRPPIRARALSCGGVFAAVSASSGERRTSFEPVDLAGQLDGQAPPAASPWRRLLAPIHVVLAQDDRPATVAVLLERAGADVARAEILVFAVVAGDRLFGLDSLRPRGTIKLLSVVGWAPVGLRERTRLWSPCRPRCTRPSTPGVDHQPLLLVVPSVPANRWNLPKVSPCPYWTTCNIWQVAALVWRHDQA
jgi:hypothetical protein